MLFVQKIDIVGGRVLDYTIIIFADIQHVPHWLCKEADEQRCLPGVAGVQARGRWWWQPMH